MDLVFRGLFMYLFLLVLLRVSGNRQFSELTSFDIVLLLMIAEATQQAMIGDDFSVTAGAIVIITLVGIDIALSHIKQWSSRADLLLDGVPVLLVDHGNYLRGNMRRERVDEEDILAAAREMQGLESIDQVKFAVLERAGHISIIPR